MIGTRTWPMPRLEAIATGDSRCAASNRPMLSLSRTFDHDTSRTSSTVKPFGGGKAAIDRDDQGRRVHERNDSRCVSFDLAHFNSSAAVSTDCAISTIFLFSFIAVLRSSA